ncbi:MAG: arginyltransferase, partial [Pseudomonadota bacterium]|nr:arginyltransferase [Pseudomonadota bacterium]
RAKEAGHAHIYLGYLIEDCRKMAYKKRFAPLQKLGQDGWEDYQPT